MLRCPSAVSRPVVYSTSFVLSRSSWRRSGFRLTSLPLTGFTHFCSPQLLRTLRPPTLSITGAVCSGLAQTVLDTGRWNTWGWDWERVLKPEVMTDREEVEVVCVWNRGRGCDLKKTENCTAGTCLAQLIRILMGMTLARMQCIYTRSKLFCGRKAALIYWHHLVLFQ